MQYYAEIENDFYLPVNVQKNINNELENSGVPKWFYEKYQNIIALIPKIRELFIKFTLNSCDDKYDNCHLKKLLHLYKMKYLNFMTNGDDDLTLLGMKNIIQSFGSILELLYRIDNTLFEKEYFISLMQLCNSALIDIGNIDGSLVKCYLPNNWLLTSKGYLYNMQSTAHEAASYSGYYLEKKNWFMTKKESCVDNSNRSFIKINPLPELSDASVILKSGCVSFNTCDALLHYVDYYHFNCRIYDSKVIMVSVGMIELRQDLFRFFEKLELYTDSPKDNLKKVIEITKDNYLDILIRCCGVSKITYPPIKTIITSSLTARSDFKEYLDKGYNVCFIPPIIINREKRIVEELNMNSLMVNSYIKNEVISTDSFDRGKVYTNHFRF